MRADKATASGSRRPTTIGQGRGGLSSSSPPFLGNWVFFAQDPPTYTVQENADEGQVIGRVQAQHHNSGETLTYRLSGADASHFTIDTNGKLELGATRLDYETQQAKVAEVGITAEDSNGHRRLQQA